MPADDDELEMGIEMGLRRTLNDGTESTDTFEKAGQSQLPPVCSKEQGQRAEDHQQERCFLSTKKTNLGEGMNLMLSLNDLGGSLDSASDDADDNYQAERNMVDRCAPLRSVVISVCVGFALTMSICLLPSSNTDPGLVAPWLIEDSRYRFQLGPNAKEQAVSANRRGLIMNELAENDVNASDSSLANGSTGMIDPIELALELEVLQYETDLLTSQDDPTFDEMYDSDLYDPNQEANDAIPDTPGSRSLQSARPPMHSVLSCNDVPMDCSTTPLSSIPLQSGAPVTVPCGSCVFVDTTDGTELNMPDGLRIEGKLLFPSSASVTIRTTYVLVLGILKMETPDQSKKVTFSLYGEDDVYFHPHSENVGACGPRGCKIGSKVVAVAGGKLDIQGYPSHCPSWENILDVGHTPTPLNSMPAPVMSSIPPHCPGQLLSNPGITRDTMSPWQGFGTPIHLICPGFDNTDCAVEARDRTDWSSGIYQTLDTSCLEAGQYWKLTFKVRMYDENTDEGLACEPGAKDIFTCPFVRIQTKKGGNYRFFEFFDVYTEWNSNGDWTHMEVVIGINEYMQDSTFTHVIFSGGPAGSVLAIDQVNMVPDYIPVVGVDICEMNMVLNSKGSDHSELTAPWRGYGGTVTLDCSGGYDDECAFRVTDRARSANGMYQALDTSCFSRGTQHFKLDFWVKMYDVRTGAGLSCSSALGTCPMARFQTKKFGVFDWHQMHDRTMDWDPDGWNRFSIVFEKPDSWFDLQVLNLVIAGGQPGVNSALLIDDITFVSWPMDQIKVSPDAAGCWSPSSELVIATNTRFTKDHRLVTVKSVNKESGTITLNEEVSAPSTVATDPEHAVEVALLNRQIVFKADGSPSDPTKGGHLFIMQTPGVAQHLEGVEIKNFGQAGTLGRYPVHFHLSENVSGSVVKKTVVRNSNQRCYVIHGSSNIMLQENVAYNTFGHCFMLEDGTEDGNEFSGNLAIHTKRMPLDKVELLNSQSARKQTDNRPGSFWITNTDNVFENNVVAGSEWHGWFFEMHSEILGASRYQDETLNPHRMSLGGRVKDNTSHGHASFGWTTYPPGWRPPETALIENLRIYRGVSSGIFVHNADNHYFKNLYVADHGLHSIWVMGGDDSTFDGAEIIGRTPGSPTSNFCDLGNDQGGIILHPIKGSHSMRGAVLKEVQFKHWSYICGSYAPTSPMELGTIQVFTPAWNAPHTFHNVEFDDSSLLALDACHLKDELGVQDVSIEVSSGIPRLGSSAPGFLVSPLLSAFGGGSCIDVQGCLNFCPGACLRTVLFHTNSAGEWTEMVVEKNGQSVAVGRVLTKNGMGKEQTLHTLSHATHGVSLPSGQYAISFKNGAGGTVYPDYVLPTFEAPPRGCNEYVTENSFEIVKPDPEGSRCEDLIKNGHFEESISGWQELNAGIAWSPSAGVDGSGALITTIPGPNAFITQWVDVSCLQAGNSYSFTMAYRVLDADGAKNAITCDAASNEHCPIATLIFESWDERTQTLTNLSPNFFSTSVEPYQQGVQFNTLSAEWQIDEQKAEAAKVRFTVRGGVGTFILDDITIRRVHPIGI